MKNTSRILSTEAYSPPCFKSSLWMKVFTGLVTLLRCLQQLMRKQVCFCFTWWPLISSWIMSDKIQLQGNCTIWFFSSWISEASCALHRDGLASSQWNRNRSLYERLQVCFINYAFIIILNQKHKLVFSFHYNA